MSKVIFIISVIGFLCSCSRENDLPSGLRGESFKPANEKRKEFILTEMKKSGIPYQINGRGFVTYLASDIVKVREIQRLSREDYDITQYDMLSALIPNSEFRKHIESALDSKKIKYAVSNSLGSINIHYMSDDIKSFDTAYQEAYFATYKNSN